ncbi:hypothetical protein SCATT_39320 [Streptantibioticus cattleyicolor NRRL 8057 = DSM 46488]|uniref:Excreted virulence factor EspC, type VII ESX diderm n=1 Tax=Streptantibioticus cattleyicolor (strain ATCC 35852 / DSM 46488 / JCM 4925 / NBRC 14057 / NRRL 8057) TaxID=1003195 RepID=G8WSR8_STREN|nr:hypothetical protein SCATT_39320 [Streptantibioticus cattleyicolor NRRL 8057 = DSM 46488]
MVDAGLRAASRVAEELGQGTAHARERLAEAHRGVAAAAEGFAFVAALGEAHRSWHDRLGRIRDDCHDIAGRISATADAHTHNDAATASSFGAGVAGR